MIGRQRLVRVDAREGARVIDEAGVAVAHAVGGALGGADGARRDADVARLLEVVDAGGGAEQQPPRVTGSEVPAPASKPSDSSRRCTLRSSLIRLPAIGSVSEPTASDTQPSGSAPLAATARALAVTAGVSVEQTQTLR